MIYLIDLREAWFMISKRTNKSSFIAVGICKLNTLLSKQFLMKNKENSYDLDIFRTDTVKLKLSCALVYSCDQKRVNKL